MVEICCLLDINMNKYINPVSGAPGWLSQLGV